MGFRRLLCHPCSRLQALLGGGQEKSLLCSAEMGIDSGCSYMSFLLFSNPLLMHMFTVSIAMISWCLGAEHTKPECEGLSHEDSSHVELDRSRPCRY